MARKECRHCKRTAIVRGRGLCCACYSSKDISPLYPSVSKFAPKTRCHYHPELEHDPGGARGHEPTMQEIEAIVAEQMANLPEWWHKEKLLVESGEEDE